MEMSRPQEALRYIKFELKTLTRELATLGLTYNDAGARATGIVHIGLPEIRRPAGGRPSYTLGPVTVSCLLLFILYCSGVSRTWCAAGRFRRWL